MALMRSMDVDGFGRVFPIVWGNIDDRRIGIFRNPSDARGYDAESLMLGEMPCTWQQDKTLLSLAGANRKALR